VANAIKKSSSLAPLILQIQGLLLFRVLFTIKAEAMMQVISRLFKRSTRFAAVSFGFKGTCSRQRESA